MSESPLCMLQSHKSLLFAGVFLKQGIPKVVGLLMVLFGEVQNSMPMRIQMMANPDVPLCAPLVEALKTPGTQHGQNQIPISRLQINMEPKKLGPCALPIT